MSVALFCRVLAKLESSTGHWLCSPPSWTAHIGKRWSPLDEQPLNLFNQWWRFGQWVLGHDMPS